MANSIVTDIDIMAEKALMAARPYLPLLSLFSNNFSDERLRKGKKVTVTQFQYPSTASKDFAGDYTDTDDLIEVPVEVTLNKHLFKSHELSQDELNNGGVKPENIEMQTQRVMQDMIDWILAGFSAANFPNATAAIAAAAFDSDEVSLIRDAVQKLHWLKKGRSMILNTDFYGALTRDASVKHVFNSGSESAIQEGVLPRLSGFNMAEYEDLDDQGEDLAGIAANKNALAIATGVIVPSKTSELIMELATATDEETGFTIGTRRFTEAKSGKEFFVSEILAGRSVGDATQGYRIVST